MPQRAVPENIFEFRQAKMTKIYRVYVTATAMPLETVTAHDAHEAIAKVRAMYPHRSDTLTAIRLKEVEAEPGRVELE